MKILIKDNEEEMRMELYKDSTQPVEKRVEDLLGRMTLEEKVAQLCGDLPMDLAVEGMPTVEQLKEKFPYGLLSKTNVASYFL